MTSVDADNWTGDIPWIGLESLHEYSRSLLDIYNQIIDYILNGSYDSTEVILNTYSDAWDNVDQSTEAFKLSREEVEAM